jgi:hypothetical protein
MESPHRGTNNGRRADEILENGMILSEKITELADQEFRNYVRANYHVERKQAQDWINAFERFGDTPKLIEDLPETIIRILASPSLEMTDVEQLIADRRNGRIKPDVRSMEAAASECRRHRGPIKQEDRPIRMSFSPQMLPLLEDIRLQKNTIETRKAALQEEIKEYDNRLAALYEERKTFDDPIDQIGRDKKEAQMEIRQCNIEIDKITAFLRFYGITESPQDANLGDSSPANETQSQSPETHSAVPVGTAE